MSELMIIKGLAALSPAQQDKQLQLWQTVLRPFTADYFYILQIEEPLNADERARLVTLLQASEDANLEADFYVLPRLGTISPWSSKAIDILRLCDLGKISRIERGIAYLFSPMIQDPDDLAFLMRTAHDRMTESVLEDKPALQQVFTPAAKRPLNTVAILTQGISALEEANKTYGLALTPDEMNYLVTTFRELNRNPSDAELMMFAQVNSEHCRHKIFRSQFVIDGVTMPHSLFAMIKNTYQAHPDSVLSAYKDNAAVMSGNEAMRFFPNTEGEYQFHAEAAPILMKVETHNHPTAIAPFAGAATGAGGEIRDEAATGIGAKSKAGLVGFTVSHLRIPQFTQAFEGIENKPAHIASPLQIMLEAPIGAARYNNEFGRPNLCGYFRSYEQPIDNDPALLRAYHKPIMIAGGMGLVRPAHVQKQLVPEESLVIILGGPNFIIGLGGGSASSVASGSSDLALDFASVQRDNAEMERRCQEVIDRCTALKENNPILSIHDIGAGGLSNAVPEILHDAGRGGELNLRALNLGDAALSPMEIWCNESQERYVLAIAPHDLALFTDIAHRERCPFAVLGVASDEAQLHLHDALFKSDVVNMPMQALFAPQTALVRHTSRAKKSPEDFVTSNLDLFESLNRILQHPTVADKSFLITIGDRSVGGLSSRDQMVGPWQVPVADVAVTLTDFQNDTGEAMAIGERTPLSVLNAPASGRMAVAEAITNSAAARIDKISDIKLSANWMAACGFREDDADLYDTVHAVGIKLCPELGLCIPVGKDSLSMRMNWQQDGRLQQAASPVSLIVTAFSKVLDVRKTLTPQLNVQEDSQLLLIDLGFGKNRLGASILAQVYQSQGGIAPDLDKAQDLKNFFTVIQMLNEQNLILAYHDRSDGGAWASLCEMAFASHCGLDIELKEAGTALEFLANEELGAVIQVRRQQLDVVLDILNTWHLKECTHVLAEINPQDEIKLRVNDEVIFSAPRVKLQQHWSRVSYELRNLRDNSECAAQEYAHILDNKDPGLSAQLSYDLNDNVAAPYINTHAKPQVAILREQGVNGHIEMAAAFAAAGFTAVDVHMSDILSGKNDLSTYVGLAACGGFSYGDVLGAGRGWASTILYHERAQEVFSRFFLRPDTFTLGVCNGCQMFAALKTVVPGAQHWPDFVQNESTQFEARVVQVEVLPSPSIFFNAMAGSRMPIIVSHGEGRAVFSSDVKNSAQLAVLRYVDNYGLPTQKYPFNPNGSPLGITGLTTGDGRITIMMPHPERMFRALQCSWREKSWRDASPWRRMFENARVWVG